MIEAVKHNEQVRREYRIMSAFEMDAREEGVQQGFADGSYKKALETAKNLIGLRLSFEDIVINESDVSGSGLKLKPTEPTHVGIYIGEGKFIHASSSKKKIVIEDIKGPYFKDRIVDIRRYK